MSNLIDVALYAGSHIGSLSSFLFIWVQPEMIPKPTYYQNIQA